MTFRYQSSETFLVSTLKSNKNVELLRVLDDELNEHPWIVEAQKAITIISEIENEGIVVTSQVYLMLASLS